MALAVFEVAVLELPVFEPAFAVDFVLTGLAADFVLADLAVVDLAAVDLAVVDLAVVDLAVVDLAVVDLTKAGFFFAEDFLGDVLFFSLGD